MKTETLKQGSALATMIGGVGFAALEIIVALYFPESLPFSQRYTGLALGIIEIVELFSLFLLLLGLVGQYLHQAEAAGRFGGIGFLFAFLGTAWSLGEVWTSAILFPGMSQEVPAYLDGLIQTPPPLVMFGVGLGFILFPLGWILYSLASIRAKIYPLLAGISLIVGVLLIPFVPIGANLLLGAGWAWMGYEVWKRTTH